MRVFFLLSLAVLCSVATVIRAEDKRVYMHGIEAVQKTDSSYLVFFSSSGLPPKGADEDGSWTHDVYVAPWHVGDKKIKPRIFIQRDEAQEPASAARTSDGHIMVSFEDGWNAHDGVSQRYGVYSETLQPIAAYPRTIEMGGHSGHVAAVGNDFVVAYSDGWIKGGGVDGLGSGDGIYVKTYDSNGRYHQDVDLAVDKREWWPMVAGSSSHALVLWQRFVPDETFAQLRMSVIDPVTGQASRQTTLNDNLRYYTYRVAYVPDIERFLITATTKDDHGFAYLIDDKGGVTAQLKCMPPVVREGGILISGTTATTPTADNRMMQLTLTPTNIAIAGFMPSPIVWQELGSVGLNATAGKQHWIGLGRDGFEEADFDLNQLTAPNSADLCE